LLKLELLEAALNFPKKYKSQEVEQKIRELWNKEDIYRYDKESEKPCFSVDTPPPYVSSSHLHVGHAMSYSQAEFVVRFKRMQGHNIHYPMGFDDNGLPTERYVEKKYKINKSKINRREFIDLCLKETKLGIQTYRELWEILGISVDWSLSYSTIDERSRRTSQRSFVELAREGLIERRDEPMLWCYRCSTAIAQAEVETLEMPSKLYDVAFQSVDGQEIVISTTRPELIPACVSLYVNPGDQRYQSLVGADVRVPLFNYQVKVRTHPDVDPAFGTGFMMVCTWGDVEDVIKWKEHKLDTRTVFDEYGRLNELAKPFTGLPMDKARKEIIAALDKEGLLKGSKDMIHNVGVHDRCSTPIEFNHTLQWFISVLDKKSELLDRGNELNWHPDFMKSRYDDWIKGLKWDWCISRQRYYGVPFPVWYCNKCDAPLFPPIQSLPVDPTVDPAPEGATCEKCGGTEFTGEKDVMDTWMTSSLTPLINARWAYDDEELMKRIYPQSIRVQAFEIIRTWLFYTVVKSHYHTGTLPWTDVMISGWGLDSKGKKMSKRAGNFVEPMTVIQKYSADALRYWSAHSTLGTNRRYNEQEVAEGKRLMTKLWNAAKFVAGYLYNEEGAPRTLSQGTPTLIDRWIISRLMATIKSSTDYFEKFEYSHSLDVTERFFFTELCDNYLEIVKERFWNPDKFDPQQVEAARFTLYTALLNVLKLFAPFIPYITEELYQIIFRDSFEETKSIHVSSWPKYDESLVDTDADTSGRLLIDVLTGVRRWKTSQQVHPTFPLREMVITTDPETAVGVKRLNDDLKAAAHAENLIYGEGGDIVTDNEKITLKLTLGEKKAL
jgi:valyl-tRNA synthetase